MDNLSRFSDSLQGFLNERNLKPIELAAKTGLDFSTVYSWLRMSTAPKLKNLTVLADFFQCSIDYLTGRTDTNNYSPSANTQAFSERLKLLMTKSSVSIRKLNAATGIAQSSLSFFRNATVEPLLDTAIKLADFFDCTLDYLAGREN